LDLLLVSHRFLAVKPEDWDTPMSVRIRNAVEARRQAEKNVNDVLREDYPIGTAVDWDDGRGYVVAHAPLGDRIQVQDAATNKEQWISAWRIR
jgi:hypothetical protein